MTYAEQLKHPEWQKKRLEVLERAQFECQNCGDKDTTLNVHHLYYKKGRKVWEYPDHAFECLCEHCHKARHEQLEELKDLLALAAVHGASNTEMVIGYLKAILADCGPYERELNSEHEGIGASDYLRINPGIIGTETELTFKPNNVCELREFARIVHGGTQGLNRWKGYQIRRGQ